ncbi:efflux RND transporter periplasmic adaptor subunit, partial [Rhizobium leguminosarum]|uniref:efflux RND transporter periplasmic adaptor subunit n=1 Tax=Rhizobium leguminosarum TaxID=384 RepID=UPI001FEF433A
FSTTVPRSTRIASLPSKASVLHTVPYESVINRFGNPECRSVLVRQQRVEWQAEVSARYLSRISEGLSVDIDGPDGRPIQGKVRLVGPSIDTNTSRAIVYVALPQDVQPRTGLYVTGAIELTTTPALTVPETAIVFRDGINYVFTAGEDKRVRRVRVETGRRTDGEVEIVSGIDFSARVVTSGGAFLSDNDLVKIAGEG